MGREPIEFFSAVLLVSENRQRLAEFYRDDVRQLEQLLGRDLRHWRASQTP